MHPTAGLPAVGCCELLVLRLDRSRLIVTQRIVGNCHRWVQHRQAESHGAPKFRGPVHFYGVLPPSLDGFDQVCNSDVIGCRQRRPDPSDR